MNQTKYEVVEVTPQEIDQARLNNEIALLLSGKVSTRQRVHSYEPLVDRGHRTPRHQVHAS